jgi:hypothetical protein
MKIKQNFRQAKIEFTEPIATFITSNDEKILLNDRRILVLIPAMNDLANRLFAAAFQSCGINSVALNIHTAEALKYGRSVGSGKECLPILLMAGNLLHYIEHQ